MKKVKMMLAAIAIVGIGGAAMAFTAHSSYSGVKATFFSTNSENGECNVSVNETFTTTSLTTSPAFLTTLSSASTTASCPTIHVIALP